MPIDAHRLLVLRAVQRAGGVVPAARVLYLSPSAVSQHLTRLEAETGSASSTAPGAVAAAPWR